jgi:hypothetical protein
MVTLATRWHGDPVRRRSGDPRCDDGAMFLCFPIYPHKNDDFRDDCRLWRRRMAVHATNTKHSEGASCVEDYIVMTLRELHDSALNDQRQHATIHIIRAAGSSWGSESASKPLVYFGVLNDNLIKGIIACVKYIGRFLMKVQMY